MRLRTRRVLLIVAVLALLGLAGCSGGDASIETTTAGANVTEAREVGSDDAPPTAGRILLSSSAITDQEGKLLVVLGPDNASRVCAAIDSDRWTLAETPLVDRVLVADSGPCDGATDDARFEPGEHFVTVGIVIPGNPVSEVTTVAAVELVDGDVSFEIDGSKLSEGVQKVGAPGRILVTMSEIRGQEGKILVVVAQGNAGSTCASIDADPWTMPAATAMTALPGPDDGPCGDGAGEVTFLTGDNLVTASIYVPGESVPRATTQLVLKVDGDVTAALDGSPLSAR